MRHPLGFGADRAGDGNLVGGAAQAEDLHIEADLHIQIVFTRLEQIRKAVGSELVPFLFFVNRVNPALDVGHARIEQEHVGAEVGWRRLDALSGLRADE